MRTQYKPGVMYETHVEGANVLRVAVGTSGKKGGDAGHGGWTRIELENMGGTDFEAQWSKREGFLSIEFRGDSELFTLKEALRYCLTVLDKQTKGFLFEDEAAELEV